jgi:hypothetical protein
MHHRLLSRPPSSRLSLSSLRLRLACLELVGRRSVCERDGVEAPLRWLELRSRSWDRSLWRCEWERDGVRWVWERLGLGWVEGGVSVLLLVCGG